MKKDNDVPQKRKMKRDDSTHQSFLYIHNMPLGMEYKIEILRLADTKSTVSATRVLRI